jgi:hypothetical protein
MEVALCCATSGPVHLIAKLCTLHKPQEYVASFRPLLLDECAALLLRGGGMSDQPPPQAVVTSGTEQVAGSSTPCRCGRPTQRTVVALQIHTASRALSASQFYKDAERSAHHTVRIKAVHSLLLQDGEFTQVHLTMNVNAPSDFSDNDCVLLSSRHPEVCAAGLRCVS